MPAGYWICYGSPAGTLTGQMSQTLPHSMTFTILARSWHARKRGGERRNSLSLSLPLSSYPSSIPPLSLCLCMYKSLCFCWTKFLLPIIPKENPWSNNDWCKKILVQYPATKLNLILQFMNQWIFWYQTCIMSKIFENLPLLQLIEPLKTPVTGKRKTSLSVYTYSSNINLLSQFFVIW